eukprot:366501-Chlamydomonas_euryale.AAC.10
MDLDCPIPVFFRPVLLQQDLVQHRPLAEPDKLGATRPIRASTFYSASFVAGTVKRPTRLYI